MEVNLGNGVELLNEMKLMSKCKQITIFISA